MVNTMDDFQGQIAVVTGATRGIGKSIAEAFLQNGARVIGLYSGAVDSTEQFIQDNEPSKDNFELFRCDVSNEADVADLFKTIEEKYNSIEILINNAGIRNDSLLALMKAEQWQHVLDVNLTGTFLMTKQAVLLMMKNKYGRIVNITSPVARLGFTGQANYSASKAGQIAMTKTLARETARKKITVNAISPGFISTDFIQDLDKEQLSSYKKMVPMRRFGTPEEVADAVLFLASKKAAYITGSVLEITGGL